MHVFSPDSLKWLGIRFLDPVGRVFEHGGGIYRAVYNERVGFVRSAWKKGVYTRAMEAGLLIESSIEKEIQVEGYGLVIRHKRLPFQPLIGELARVQALDYARLILDLNLLILEVDEGFGLIDSHAKNICQQGCARPVWIDLGSIRTLKSVDVGLEEFKSLWWRPLRIAAAQPKLWNLVRLAMQNGGLGAAEYAALGGVDDLPQPAGEMKEARKILLGALRDSLPAKLESDETFWTNYHGENILPATYSGQGPRFDAIQGIIRQLKPRTVIDLACANGRFSFMAAREGAQVLAVDYDEGGIERCYATMRACEEPLSVTVANHDILTRRLSYPKADVVMALAVTHHLSLTQMFPFTYIAKHLANFTTGALITEFMPNGLCAQVKPDVLPDWYRLDLFLKAFEEAFKKVRVIPVKTSEDSSPRTLVLCESPKL